MKHQEDISNLISFTGVIAGSNHAFETWCLASVDALIMYCVWAKACGWPVTRFDFLQTTIFITFLKSPVPWLCREGSPFYDGFTPGSRLTQSGPLLMTSPLKGAIFGASGIPFQQRQTGLLLCSLLTVCSSVCFFPSSLPPAVARCLLCVLRSEKANVLKGWFLSPCAYWNHVNAICA